MSEKDLKTSRTDFLQLRIQREDYTDTGRRDRHTVQGQVGEISPTAEAPAKSKGSRPHIRLPSRREYLHLENELP